MDIPWVEVAFADSGNARVLGAPWWKAKHGPDSFALYFMLSLGTVVRMYEEGTGLDAQAERVLLALHEAGHATIVNGLGLEVGGLRINSDRPQTFGGRPALARYASIDIEFPTTGPAVAAVALAGWLAAEAWLTMCNGGARPSVDSTSLAFAYLGAADDHDFIVGRKTDEPTAYLYGRALPPAGWDGRVVVVDEIARTVGRLLTEDSQRFERMVYLAQHAVGTGTVPRDAVAQILEPPGWAVGAIG
jgi:hypothetical protein